MLGPKLSASRRNITALLAAYGCINFVTLQNSLKRENIVPWRSLEIPLGHEINRN
jgi:hypothetical protein